MYFCFRVYFKARRIHYIYLLQNSKSKQTADNCKQKAENQEFKDCTVAKKSWNFNDFASNSKSKQTGDIM